MIDLLLLKLRARDEIAADEEQALRACAVEAREVPADFVCVPHGVELDFSTLLLDGIMSRQKDLQGGERQITELHVPGDFADLHSFTLKKLDHEVMTLTRCRIALCPHERLQDITERFPHLTRVLWFHTNLDAAIHREWEVSLGRRDAVARLANLFCEIQQRLALVGQADDQGFSFPLTQVELADCTGITPVHVNRSLRSLREQGIVEFRDGRVIIPDLNALQRAAEFDPSYLYLERRHR